MQPPYPNTLPVISRREFIRYAGLAGGTLLLGSRGGLAMNRDALHRVAVVHTEDRRRGVTRAIETLGINPAKNKNVLIKPNFNTADSVPGSTHNDTLVALVETLWEMGAATITLGERSYPLTREVMQAKGVIPLLEKLDVRINDFDQLPEQDWVKVDAPGSHWQDGFRIARPVLESECLVATGCLKTHQFGGVFTMSLKLHVGVVPTTRHGFHYMSELHASPHQRKMIAEINAPFAPALVVMDGIDVFVDGGPMTGRRARADVFLAATDRVAVDAVGLAVLKDLGSNAQIMGRPVFAQEQIARAVELGLGASGPEQIELVTPDEQSRAHSARIAAALSSG
jgi:uncharacterized protein (DUF362 family)